MAEEKKKVLKITTPAGIARYPWLTIADTRFKPEGEYKCNLILTAEASVELRAQLDGLVDAAVEAIKADLIAKKKPNDAKKVIRGDAYEEEVDEATGEPSGNFIFKFKCPTQITTKQKEVIIFSVAVFDAKKQKLEASVYGGSTIKVNFTPREYYVASTKAAGVSLRLNAVQVLNLVTSNSGSADSYGFDEEESAGVEETGVTGEPTDF